MSQTKLNVSEAIQQAIKTNKAVRFYFDDGDDTIINPYTARALDGLLSASSIEVAERYRELMQKRRFTFAKMMSKASAYQDEGGDEGEDEAGESYAQSYNKEYFAELQNARERTNACMEKFNAISMIEAKAAPNWKDVVVNPNPLPPEVLQLRTRTTNKQQWLVGLLISGTVIAIMHPQSYVPWAMFLPAIILLFIIGPSKKIIEEKARRFKALEIAADIYDKEVARWEDFASGKSAINYRCEKSKIAPEHLKFIKEVNSKIESIHNHAKSDQMQSYLKNILIEDYDISGLGSTRRVTLTNHGITCANDIIRRKFFEDQRSIIPNIGDGVYRSLEIWRNNCEKDFEFDPKNANYRNRIKALEQEVELEKRQIAFESALSEAVDELKQKINKVQEQRQNFSGQIEQATIMRAQAERDFQHMNSSNTSAAYIAVGIFVIGAIAARDISEAIKIFGAASQVAQQPQKLAFQAKTNVPSAIPAQPRERTPIMPPSTNISNLVGKDSASALDDPVFKEKFKLLLGDKLGEFRDRLQASSGIRQEGEWLVGDGGMPHLFSIAEAAFAINLITSETYAIMLTDGKEITWFGTHDVKNLPVALQNWYKDHGGNF